MKITQEIKTMDAAEIAKINAIQVEMDLKSAEFLANDSEIYIKNTIP
jgi:phosphomethylpyrimidine synthase